MQVSIFCERIAQAAAAGGRIVVVGHGKRHSNPVRCLVEHLQAHHRQAYRRVVTEVVAGFSSLTAPQLFHPARRALRGAVA